MKKGLYLHRQIISAMGAILSCPTIRGHAMEGSARNAATAQWCTGHAWNHTTQHSGVWNLFLEIRSCQIGLLSIPLILEVVFSKVKSSHLYKDGLVSPH